MQLVELQRNVANRAEVAVMALSYDPVDTLAGFAEQHGITYPLLADEGSVTIERLGLLNHQIVEERAFWDRAMEERHQRLPFPGTFLLDADGIVTEKLFERSHRLRPGGKVLLERLGLEAPDPDAVATAEGPALAVAAWVDTPEYYPNQLNRLHLRLAVAEGYHVYVPSNPAGYTDLTVELAGADGLFSYSAGLPAGQPFTIEGLGEDFSVATGELDVSVPFYLLEDSGAVDLGVTLRYQACDASTCLPPEALNLTIPLAEVRA